MTRSVTREVETSSRNKVTTQTIEILHSPFIHAHPLISDHRIASIEQIEISSVTSSHQLRNQAESPVKKPEKLKKQSRHRTRRSYNAGKEPARRMLKESPSPGNKAGETCLKMHGFPEAKPKER
ncbi:hypothetical protein Bca52824_072359 [Brassica carinata]|uniref:Uncharacterized protein n=1 Tax=Brassica carinata TaxID=52824 RepID=A0A8X7Q7Z9_BRACI|nr:hypothetical protein Bca52824_072359 [Brassica carinata]